MTERSKKLLRQCVRSEIEAFERDIADRRPARSYVPPHDLMAPAGDARETYLAGLRHAAAELEAVRVTP